MTSITNLLRDMSLRLAQLGAVTLEGDFYAENMAPMDPDGLAFWISEKSMGFQDTVWTNKRLRPVPFMVQYLLFVPEGSGTALMDEKLAIVLRAFSPIDPDLSHIEGEGYHATVRKVKIDDGMLQDGWYIRPVLVTLDVAAHA